MREFFVMSFFLIVGRLLVMWLLMLFFYSTIHAEELIFKHGSHYLSGHYLEPSNGKPIKAILLFVHGDGPTSYDADGYYNIIWKALRNNGYAIYSWDKANIGKSTGNWLEQSMEDRQSEVLAAIEAVQNKYGFTAKNTGLFGFSQAGWVLPALANKSNKISFIIGIGFARNWIKQGQYLTETRLANENKNDIALAIDDYLDEIAYFKNSISYDEYLKIGRKQAMTKERFQFVMNNFEVDATHEYLKISVPSLFLWGEKDLNVNAIEEYKWWHSHTNKLVTTQIISNASHGMLKAEIFNTQNMGFIQWVKLIWLEQDAFVPDFLSTVLLWLEKETN